MSDESRADNTFVLSLNSSISPTAASNRTLSSGSSNPPGKPSSSFPISSTPSTPEPVDSQSANSRSLSSTGPRPMSSSAFTSTQSFNASRPTRSAAAPEDSNNDFTPMPSSTTSSKPVSTTTGRQSGNPAPPATTSSEGDSKNTVSDPPSKTPTKDNSQSSKTGGSSSSGTTKAVASDAANSKPTASGGGKKGSTAPKQSVSSTVEVVSVRPSNTSTILMTITSSPTTTLSIPSSISITNSRNGDVVLTAPPLITILSTSTGSDGAWVTQTQLVANPPVALDGEASTGFLARHDQVAGVFTVVGVFAAAFVFALIWFIRRHRRRQRRREWFASLQQYPPSPFAEASANSQMRSIHTVTETMPDPHTVNYETAGYRPRVSLESTAEGPAGLGLVGSGSANGVLVPLRRPLSSGDPFRDPPHVPRNTPVSFSPNYDRQYGSPSASIAPSSPSIYPESLPPAADTVTDSSSPVDSEPKSQARYFPEPILRRSLSVTSHPDAPPRPPRSHLRESPKTTSVLPLTPPASVSSYGHSDSEPQFLFHPMRRNMPHTRREESRT